MSVHGPDKDPRRRRPRLALLTPWTVGDVRAGTGDIIPATYEAEPRQQPFQSRKPFVPELTAATLPRRRRDEESASLGANDSSNFLILTT